MLVDQAFLADVQGIVARVDAAYRTPVERNLDLLLGAGVTSFERLVETLSDERAGPEFRSIACWFLGQTPDRRAGPALLAAFRDTTLSASLRGEVARSLGSRHYQRAAQALVRALKSPEPTLRVEVVRALAALNSERAIVPMIEVLRDDLDLDVRVWAIQALGRLDGQAAVVVLRATLPDQRQPPAIRGMAAEALVYARAFEATADLIGVLREPTVRFWSAYALGELAGVEAVPELEPLLGNGVATARDQKIATGSHPLDTRCGTLCAYHGMYGISSPRRFA